MGVLYIYNSLKRKKGMFFLTGEYDHQIDAKNRIRIPTKLRGSEERLYFSKGTGGCIFVLYENEMNENLSKLREVKMTDLSKQRGLRSFTNSIKLVEMDQQGRFVIPPELINFAKINKDIKICGSGSRIEVWSKERYDAYMSGVEIDDEEVVRFDKVMSELGTI